MRSIERGKLILSFLPVQRQNDRHTCGLIVIAFAAEILDGAAPIDAVFDVKEMVPHLICCLDNQKLLLLQNLLNTMNCSILYCTCKRIDGIFISVHLTV